MGDQMNKEKVDFKVPQRCLHTLAPSSTCSPRSQQEWMFQDWFGSLLGGLGFRAGRCWTLGGFLLAAFLLAVLLQCCGPGGKAEHLHPPYPKPAFAAQLVRNDPHLNRFGA